MSARSIRKASRALSAVEPSDYAAIAAIDPGTLSALVRRVTIGARSFPRSDEVQSLASLIVARLHAHNGSDVDKSARAACMLASRTVATAYAGVDSLDAWAGEYGDSMVEAVMTTGTDRTDVPRAWCPRPDAAYATTDTDVIAAALDSLTGTDHGRILRDAAAAYLAHGDRRCTVCEDVTTAGRRVTLAGILAHTRGLTADDSQYHAIRRGVLAALAALDVAAIREEHYYPHAEGGKSGSVTLDREPALEGPGTREREARSLPDTDAVRVLQPCERCTETAAYARTAADRRHILRRCTTGHCASAWPHGGYGRAYVTTHARIVAAAPDRSDDDKRADRIAQTMAAAPSRAVKVGNRKRSGGTGAYGSQVGARLSR